MTVPKTHGGAWRFAPPLRQRAEAVIVSVRDWASTEVGGWIIVGALALAAVAIAVAALILPSINDAETRLQVRATAPASAPQTPAGDLADDVPP